ncbi:MAG: hypothetical protein KDA32_08660, partial [Phycisphaerales bacterium]|nr:hypothetical protein [Phycisphaerales bacterium]
MRRSPVMWTILGCWCVCMSAGALARPDVEPLRLQGMDVVPVVGPIMQDLLDNMGQGVAQARARGACCFSDGSCDIRNQRQCERAGGVYQGNGTDCSACAPEPVGACCYPQADHEVCQELTADACAALGGSYSGDGTNCVTDGCPPAGAGACCIFDIEGHGSCIKLFE